MTQSIFKWFVMLLELLTAPLRPAADPELPPPVVIQAEPETLPPAPAEVDPTHAAEIRSVDDLLNALERAGHDLQTLRSDLYYTKLFVREGDMQTRMGTLYLDASRGHDRRRFAVHWNDLIVDGRRQVDYRHAYIFDGEWLVERLDKEKQFIKRQVVPPGERFDPLRLGEGPFPIPIGQSREDILSRFSASMPAVTDSIPEGVPIEVITSAPTYQLRLLPRPEFEREIQLSEIRIWYRHDTLLPVIAWTRTPENNESTVVLLGQPVRDEPIDPALLDTTTPARGWDVQITTYRQETDRRP
ncbi:MAG: hypothetical protein KF866_07495 [Phycisphaeraceae bacterium]|nr:hypothetical protein [Phycisphaeraceae bacterium]MCW5753724.1 hypothetical protein [Phycisphaeraceae bacterium]